MSFNKLSKTHSRLSARQMAKALDMKDVSNAAVAQLARLGIVFDHSIVQDQIKYLVGKGAIRTGMAMDANFTAPITTPSMATPIQFLQTWLPGFVKVLTSARKIDDLIGIKTVGSWEDEEIVQVIVEPSGVATEYGDYTNIPFTSWNTNFERRTIVRGEQGMQVALLEEARAAAMRLNSAETKRQQASVSLEIFRNAVGFYGWNVNGTNRTFGFLNDPNLLPAITTSVTGGWSAGSFQNIIGDIRMAIMTLRTQSQDQIDPEAIDLTLALPMNRVDYLSVTTDFGISVRDWLKQTYPKMRIVSAPELQGKDTSTNILYLYAEDIPSSLDGSSDGGEVFAQLVQTKFITLGVEKRAKSYIEDYSNAIAGVLCKRPWAVVRVVGI